MTWTLLRPEWLWLLAGLPLLALARPRRARGGERALHFAALLCSMAAWVLLTLGVAGPARERKLPDLAAALLLDRSASMDGERWERALALARSYSEALEEPPIIVVDASAPLPVTDLRQARDLPPSAPEAGSDPQPAVEEVLSLLKARSERRLLWISDGAVSGADMDRVFAGAAVADLKVYPVPVDGGPPWVSLLDLQLDQDVREGEEVSARVRLRSPEPLSLELVMEGLDAAGAPKPMLRRTVETAGGIEEVTLRFSAPGPGLHRYRVRAAVADDLPWDDSRDAVLRVAAPDRVHLVRAGAGTGDSVIRALRRVSVGRADIGELPRLSSASLRAMGPSDTLVLFDPSFETMEAELAEELGRAVRRGVRLLALAGPNELAVPDDADHPGKDMLPLTLPKKKKKEPAPMAVVFCVDRSDSMGGGTKFELALAAVANTVSLLNPEAEVAVITFNDFPDLSRPLGPVTNPKEFARELSRLRVSGGTSIYPALEMANEMLKGSDARVKHLFVTTDGRSMTTFSRNGSVVDSLRRNKVTVSAVGLGQDVDMAELENIAAAGGGRAYAVNDLSELPRIYLEETLDVVRRNRVERATPVVPIEGSRFLEGLDMGRVPGVRGYVRTRHKPSSELAMATDRGEPILISWRYGRGAVTVLTVEPDSEQTADWADWPQAGDFYRRMVTEAMRVSEPPYIRLESEPAPGGHLLHFEARDTLHNPRGDLLVELSVLAPGAAPQTQAMRPSAPGRYSAAVANRGESAVLAVAAAVGERPDPVGASSGPVPGGEASRSVAPAPPLEALLGTMNRAALERAARRTGGMMSPSPEEFAGKDVAERTELDERSMPLLWAALILWGVALVLRRAGSFVS